MTIASAGKWNRFGSRGPWSWLGRVSRVKFGDNLGHMTEFGRKHPGSLFISAFITSPMDQVQEVTVSSVVINGEKEIYQRDNAIQTKESRSKHREVPISISLLFSLNSYNV